MGAIGCSPGDAGLDDCRTYAVQWDGAQPNFTPLVIDESSGEVTYTQPGVGGVTTYDGIDDFVVEGTVLGRFTRTSSVAQNFEARTATYDGSGQQTELTRETNSAGPIGYETVSWTDHDGQSRPTAGTLESSWTDNGSTTRLDICTNAAVTVSYDETERTVTTVVDYSAGTLEAGGACVDTPFINILGRVEIDYFDGANNWLRSEVWNGFQEPSGDPQAILVVGQPTGSETVCP